MATMQELEAALVKADAAGNTEDARAFAAEIRRMRASQKVAPEVDTSVPSVTDGMSGTEKFFAGMGKSFSDTAKGLYQAGLESAERTALPVGAILKNVGADGLADAYTRAVASPVVSAASAAREDAAQTRERDAALTSTGAGLAGNVTGTLATLIGPGLATRGTAAGAALLPRTVAGNAAQGAVLGALQPHTDAGDQVGNTAIGGTLGAVGAAVPGLLRAGYRGVRNLLPGSLSGVERAAAREIQGQATEQGIPNIVRSAVPGVQRTLGEATTDPGLMRLENAIRAAQGDTFRPVDRANNLARVEALQGIAGTEADMQAAIAARNAAGSSAREEAMRGGGVGLTDTLEAAQQAIAGQRGRPAVQRGLQEAQGLLRNDAAAVYGPGGQMEVIDNVRKSLGDMLSGKYSADTSAALTGSRELIGVRDTLNNEVSRQVPAFGDYLRAWREGSVPINRMEVGRELLDRSASATPDEMGVRTLLPAQFSRQMNDLDATAARATGFDKAKAADVLTPDDLNLLRSIQDDMSRQFSRQGSATTGSQTAERMKVLGSLGRRGAEGIVGWLPGNVGNLARDAARGIDAGAQQRLQAKIAQLIANPDDYVRILQRLGPEDRKALETVVGQLTARTSTATTPALTE